MSGLGDKLKGSVDEIAGKITGDQKLEAKGKAEQIAGNVKDRAEDAKDAVGEKVNEALDKVKDKTGDKPKKSQQKVVNGHGQLSLGIAAFCYNYFYMARKIEQLGVTSDGREVFLDYADTNIAYHLLETPSLLNLVREALPSMKVSNEKQVVVEKDMGRVVGTTNLVGTDHGDEIVYAKRRGREKYSRFVKNKQLVPK